MREEFNENYEMTLFQEQEKKQDVKKVVVKKVYSFDEIFQMIKDRVDKKENYMRIKDDLINEMKLSLTIE